MSETERLLYLIEITCNGSQAEFARRIDITPSAMNKLIKGKELRLSEHYIDKISKAFPNLNPQFLRDGVSYPGDLTVQVVKAKYENEITRLKSEAEEWKNQAVTMRKALDKLLETL